MNTTANAVQKIPRLSPHLDPARRFHQHGRKYPHWQDHRGRAVLTDGSILPWLPHCSGPRPPPGPDEGDLSLGQEIMNLPPPCWETPEEKWRIWWKVEYCVYCGWSCNYSSGAGPITNLDSVFFCRFGSSSTSTVTFALLSLTLCILVEDGWTHLLHFDCPVVGMSTKKKWCVCVHTPGVCVWTTVSRWWWFVGVTALELQGCNIMTNLSVAVESKI